MDQGAPRVQTLTRRLRKCDSCVIDDDFDDCVCGSLLAVAMPAQESTRSGRRPREAAPSVAATTPPAAAPQGAAAPARGGGGRGAGGGASVIMTLNTTAWPDGGTIPLRYTQAGPEISPGIQWSGAPAGTASFVLIFHDADSLVANSTDGLLHWLVWNIPGTATSLAQAQPDGFETAERNASDQRQRLPLSWTRCSRIRTGASLHHGDLCPGYHARH